jgi:hypothetical protein
MLQVGLAFPKEDSLYTGIQSGMERLGWGAGIRISPEEWSSLATDSSSIDLLIIDYRQPKLHPQNVLNLIR